MQTRKIVTIFFRAACALSTVARGQNVYKCGNVYSQMPCPGSQVIYTTDTRTAAQKSQTDSFISRDVRLADAMEKARLKQEKSDLAANTPKIKPLNKPVSAKTPKKVNARSVKVKKKELPEYFVAQRPGDKKKKSTSSRAMSVKDATQR